MNIDMHLLGVGLFSQQRQNGSIEIAAIEGRFVRGISLNLQNRDSCWGHSIGGKRGQSYLPLSGKEPRVILGIFWQWLLPISWFSRRLADATYGILKNRTEFFQQDSFLKHFEPMTIIADLSDLLVEQISITHEVTITARAASPTAPCPCCGAISKRAQSRYTRTLRDLPASGRPVHLVLQVRRFFCQEPSCDRQIFAERFPSLTLPRVRFTLRLQAANVMSLNTSGI